VTCWASVPIKSRAHCKRRLATTLRPAERVEFVRRMLDHVLLTAERCVGIDRILVVSPERDRVPDGVTVLHDDGTNLNEALEAARREARAGGATELVILPADLPRLEIGDLDALLEAGRRAGIALAPDRADAGTNGLYLNAALELPFRFGSRSRSEHVAAAGALGVDCAIVRCGGFAFDVDTGDDFRRLTQQRPGAPRSGDERRVAES
jgi:2-phospho-L-lactate guanylyltransferase